MPPQIQELLENRRLLAMIAGGVGLVLLVIIIIMVMMGNNSGGGAKTGKITTKPLMENQLVLATTDNIGRAIEIQALMAREGINLTREDKEGGKFNLDFDKGATTDDRDRALVTLVQSGLMDKNVGLEVFDKSDLTASRDEKRIKLIRARNGELSRLIRKIDPIQDAAVFISIPEPSLFEKEKPMPKATIQITLANGERLSHDKIRSIINLLVGSVEDLNPGNVSLSDTNGNVYNSILDPGDEMMSLLEERDKYMEQKVKSQLDKLIGPSKYVATVSTYLREATREEMSLEYAPEGSSVAKSSSFSENLNSAQKNTGLLIGGPSTSNLPKDLQGPLDASTAADSTNQGYIRSGRETEFNTGKRQVMTDYRPGTIEEISVAVTVNQDAYPENISVEELQRLVARAASPLVQTSNVTILTRAANVDASTTHPLSPKIAENVSNIPGWIVWVGAGSCGLMVLLILFALLRPTGDKQAQFEQAQALQDLRDLSNNQAQQLQFQQQQTQQILEMQQQQFAQMQAAAEAPKRTPEDIENSLAEIKNILLENDSELANKPVAETDEGIQSWIEAV